MPEPAKVSNQGDAVTANFSHSAVVLPVVVSDQQLTGMEPERNTQMGRPCECWKSPRILQRQCLWALQRKH